MAPTTVAAQGGAEEELASASGGRAKRPARVPRARDGQEAPGGTDARTQVLPPLPRSGTQPPDVAEADDPPADHLPDADAAPGEDAAPSIEEAETLEYEALPHAVRPQAAAASASTPGTPSDGLPWPLPLQMIVGGRYRVEAQVPQTTPGSDAVYVALDLKGYARCWSCGRENGEEASAEKYCRDCGADMLSREYMLYESLDPSQAAAPEAPTGDTFTQGTRTYYVVAREAEVPLFPQGVVLLAASATDVGRTRVGEENEDSAGGLQMHVSHQSRSQPLGVWLVADGLGGHASGATASRLVVREVLCYLAQISSDLVLHLPENGPEGFTGAQQVLHEAVQEANDALCKANAEQHADMGSTLVAALVSGETAYIANVGDSRAYVLEGGALRRISTDHSLVEQFVAAGMITDEERYSHPQRNQILRSLGTESPVEVDIFVQRLRPGMRMLLCSDGLWEMVRDDACARILREAPGPHTAAMQLVSAANEAGGEDNITAVVLEVRA